LKGAFSFVPGRPGQHGAGGAAVDQIQGRKASSGPQRGRRRPSISRRREIPCERLAGRLMRFSRRYRGFTHAHSRYQPQTIKVLPTSNQGFTHNEFKVLPTENKIKSFVISRLKNLLTKLAEALTNLFF